MNSAERRAVGSESAAAALLSALRPRQWVKNLFVFAALVFASGVDELDAWISSSACFAVFCAASSAAYLLNDIVDVQADRGHPRKRDRAIASGRLGVPAAAAAAAVLAVTALAASAGIGGDVTLYVAVFLAMQVAYSLGLKHVVALDLVLISILFVLRAAAGAAAIDVSISTWLLLATGMVALFLGLGKRRAELAQVEAGSTEGRRVLGRYGPRALDRSLGVLLVLTMLVYVVYALVERSPLFLATVPFVVFGLLRYRRLLDRDDVGEEPENVLLTDAPLLAAVAAWALLSAVLGVR